MARQGSRGTVYYCYHSSTDLRFVSIQRGNDMLSAEGETVLSKGDVVSLLARPDAEGVRHAPTGTEEAPGRRPQGPEFD